MQCSGEHNSQKDSIEKSLVQDTLWGKSLKAIYASVQRPKTANSALSMGIEAQVGRLEQLFCYEEATNSSNLSQEGYAA